MGARIALTDHGSPKDITLKKIRVMGGGCALVVNHGDGTVSAVDLKTPGVVARWDVGPMPYGPRPGLD